MVDQRFDHRLNGFSFDIHVRGCGIEFGRTQIWLLVRREFRVHPQPVLDVVYSELRSFAKTNRAQMSCYGQSPAMRFLNRRFGFRPRHIGVKLERRCAFSRPVLHHAARVLRPADRAKLRQRIAFPRDIGTSYTDLGADQSSGVDLLLDFQIRVGLKRTSRANCRNSVREIQPRKAERHDVSEQVICVEKVADIKKMVMHADESGKRRVSGEVDALRARRNVDRAGKSEGSDAAAGYDNRLVSTCRRSCAVNNRGVFKGDERRRYTNEFFPSREALRWNGCQQFVHFAEAAAPTALVLPSRLFTLETGLRQN